MVSSQKKPTEEELVTESSTEEERPELVDRLKEVDGVSDDIADTIAQNWQRVLSGIIIIGLIVWAINGYQKGRQKVLDEAALGFVQAQSAFSTLANTNNDVGGSETSPLASDNTTDENAEKKEKEADANNSSKRAFNDTMSLLASNSSTGTYSRLAIIYQAMGDAKAGEYQKALDKLKSFSTNQYFSTNTVSPVGEVTNDQFVNEIAALMTLKIALIKDPKQISKIWPQLLSLTRSSQLVSVESLVTALRLADDSSKSKEVLKIANELATTRPAFRDLINNELRAFGQDLDKPVKESNSGE